MLTWITNNSGTGYTATGAGGRDYSILRNNGRFRWASGGGKELVGTLKDLKARCEECNDSVAKDLADQATEDKLVDEKFGGDRGAMVTHFREKQLVEDAAVDSPATAVNRGGQHGPSPLDGTKEDADAIYDAMPKTAVVPVPPSRVVPLEDAELGKRFLADRTMLVPEKDHLSKKSVLATVLSTRPKDTSPHLIVEARAGTGKTTTLIEGLKRIKGCPTLGFVPSPQQQAVFDAMELSRGKANSIMFVAFNKSIAEELKRRVPAGCEASTMHGLGFKSVNQAFRGLRVEQNRVGNVVADLLGRDIRDLRREKPALVQAACRLVGLCKMNLTGCNAPLGDDELSVLASHYDVDLEGVRADVFALVPRVLARCRDVEADKCLDFDDMIWLPVALDLAVAKHDLLLVDEAQDLNRCQQELAKRAGRRLILCCDPKQAIYGFAGADVESLPRMGQELAATDRGCTLLPLTITRRCGKAIVREARRYVPDFDAFETNPPGTVSYSRMEDKDSVVPADRIYRRIVNDGDMVLCRVNAPLVKECFRFLKAGRKANIQGRDVGQGLISTVTKMKVTTVLQLIPKLQEWLDHETKKELVKKNPSEARIESLQDRVDCLLCFTDGLRTVDEVVRRVESVFTDSKDAAGVKLSSIHKAKGLESRRVFLLQPKGCGPRRDKMKAWEAGQEDNLQYVAITRAVEELVYVS